MKNVSAAQLVPMLRPLVPQQGHLAAYPSGNVLIISDRADLLEGKNVAATDVKSLLLDAIFA